MRKHRTVKFVAALLFLCAFVFLVIGIIAAVMVGRGGLGAGWGTGWRGWLWIPLAAGACLNAVLFLVAGAVLQFLVKIDNNLALSRARQAELLAAPVILPPEAAAEPEPRAEEVEVVAPIEVAPAVIEVSEEAHPEPEEVLAPEQAPIVISESETVEAVTETESIVEELPTAVTPVGMTLGAAAEQVVEVSAEPAEQLLAPEEAGIISEATTSEVAETVAESKETLGQGVVEPELTQADLEALVMTPEMVSPELAVVAPEPVEVEQVAVAPEQPAETEVAVPTPESPQEIESAIAEQAEAFVAVSEETAIPEPAAPPVPEQQETKEATIEGLSDVPIVADAEILAESAEEPASGFQIQPEVEIGEPELQAPEEEPAPTPFPRAEEGEPGVSAGVQEAATPDEAAWPIASAEDLTSLPWEMGVEGSSQAGLAATEGELPNAGPVHIEGGKAPSRLPGSEEAARVAAEMHAQRPSTEGGYGAIPSGDDFTRIHGVGPVFARRLREVGVTTYAALAEASDELLNRITDGNLDRVEHDDWRGQARKLLG